ANCLHGTSRVPRTLTQDGKVHVSKFGYSGAQGPVNWNNLAAENEGCSTGTSQSPINLDCSLRSTAKSPFVAIANVQSAEIENIGTGVEVLVNGSTGFNGTNYLLKQIHFHTPSEHRINEEYFPLEMHMVHEPADPSSGQMMIMAVLFEMSSNTTTQLLTSITKSMSQVSAPGSIATTGPLDFVELDAHLASSTFLVYNGSASTPPCSEDILYLAAEKALPVDVQTFNTIKKVVKFNSRYTQNAPGKENLLRLQARHGGGGEEGQGQDGQDGGDASG
ncbi:carbonic anhydrase, partial [Aulographum hederae CBS 113979]